MTSLARKMKRKSMLARREQQILDISEKLDDATKRREISVLSSKYADRSYIYRTFGALTPDALLAFHQRNQ